MQPLHSERLASSGRRKEAACCRAQGLTLRAEARVGWQGSLADRTSAQSRQGNQSRMTVTCNAEACEHYASHALHPIQVWWGPGDRPTDSGRAGQWPKAAQLSSMAAEDDPVENGGPAEGDDADFDEANAFDGGSEDADAGADDDSVATEEDGLAVSPALVGGCPAVRRLLASTLVYAVKAGCWSPCGAWLLWCAPGMVTGRASDRAEHSCSWTGLMVFSHSSSLSCVFAHAQQLDASAASRAPALWVPGPLSA